MTSLKRLAPAAMAALALTLAGCGAATPAASPASPSSAAASPAAKPPAASSPAASSPAAKPAGSVAAAKPSAAAPAGASAGASAKPSGPSIKVGFIAPLSGPVAAYGAGVKYAPVLAAQEANASGGINGSPLEVVTLDSPNNPSQAVTDMRRLTDQDKVFAIVGPYYTGEMQAAVPLLKSLKVPTLAYTPAASYPGFVEPNEWAFLSDTNDEKTSGAATDAFKKVNPNVKKMLVVGDAQTAVTALMIKTLWPKILPDRGYQIVDTITYEFNTSDFSPIVTRIKAANADGMALSSLTPAAANLLKEMERQGVKLPIVSSAHLQTVPPFPQILGKTADGMIQSLWFSPAEASKPSVKAWVDRYAALAAADSPNHEKPVVGYANEIQTYDAFAILIKALRDSGVKPDTAPAEAREKVRASLMKIKGFPGVLRSKDVTSEGRITWDVYPLIAKDGAWVAIS